MNGRPRFKVQDIGYWAKRYEYNQDSFDLADRRQPVRNRGYLTMDDLRAVLQWKSPRAAWHIEKNEANFVRQITGFSLNTSNERARVEALTLLDGVQYPVASVILHFFHKGRYPIIDYRALWSLSHEVPSQYGFEFWFKYVEDCREIGQVAGVDMRTVDMALWQYSKENQPPV
jgi:hypothetical protein